MAQTYLPAPLTFYFSLSHPNAHPTLLQKKKFITGDFLLYLGSLYISSANLRSYEAINLYQALRHDAPGVFYLGLMVCYHEHVHVGVFKILRCTDWRGV